MDIDNYTQNKHLLHQLNSAVNNGDIILTGNLPGKEQMEYDFKWLDKEPVREAPVCLRFYTWNYPVITIGYHQKVNEIKNDAGLEIVRRPTGGGAVYHDRDLSFTLMVQRKNPAMDFSIFDMYGTTHSVFMKTLEKYGITSHIVDRSKEKKHSAYCFTQEGVMPFDVIDNAGRKIVGTAQRRNRNWIMLQGSIASICFGDKLSTENIWDDFYSPDFIPAFIETLKEKN